MMTTAIHREHYNAHEAVLFMACELSENTEKLGVTIGLGQTPRDRTIAARAPKRLIEEAAHAKSRVGLGQTVPVVRCYEAGCEGFGLHCFSQAPGLPHSVGDSSSLEVNRR